MTQNNSKQKAEATKVVAEQPKVLVLPNATYKTQARNNADIKDVLEHQSKVKRS